MSRVAAAATCLALDLGHLSGYPYRQNNPEVTNRGHNHGNNASVTVTVTVTVTATATVSVSEADPV